MKRSSLEALNNLTQLAFYYAEDNGCLENAKEYKDIIETALNDNYFYKHMISKICDFMGLDIINPFEDLVDTENMMINYICENDCFRVDVATNKNNLKAFEIIKKEISGCLEFYYDEEHDYGEVWCVQNEEESRVLIASANSKEEYDLLKEVLS